MTLILKSFTYHKIVRITVLMITEQLGSKIGYELVVRTGVKTFANSTGLT